MKMARLTRTKDTGKETLGIFTCYDEDGSTELFTCKTVELPWKDNQRRVSCIPLGRYEVRSCKASPHIQYKHYDILDVPGRDGVKIHSANYVFQLLGCIAVGNSHVDINGDGELDVANSRVTLAKLISFMGERFELIIQ